MAKVIGNGASRETTVSTGGRAERTPAPSRLGTFLFGVILSAVVLGGLGAVVWHYHRTSEALGDAKPSSSGSGDVGDPLPGQLTLADLSVPDGMGGIPGNDYPYRNLAQDSRFDPWREYVRECTSFVAWALHSRNHFEMPFYANAIDWGTMAKQRGFVVNSKPVVGAVAWSNKAPYGHVAWVSAVSGSSVTIQEYNEYGNGTYDSRKVSAGTFQYIHFSDLPTATSNTGKASTTPAKAKAPSSADSATNTNSPAPTGSSSPNSESGQPEPTNSSTSGTAGTSPQTPVTSSSVASSTTSALPPVVTKAPTPAPPVPVTHREQASVHHGVPTFSNPNNASGAGSAIPTGAWVQVTCKLYKPSIASASPDGYWYKIASSPWNNSYYAVANTFMNGDPDNGPYTHNTDFGVPNC